ncbi:MAG: transcription-repair coupling factor [Streptococcaceae bacterium]|jgi:transcription-repair coupling factor (superfamily II helicase)|nr:transcription-repair coupling factor [Streptococcaceae bacterium]
MNLIDLFSKNEKITQWLTNLAHYNRQLLTGLVGSAKSLAIAAAYQDKPRQILVVVKHQSQAARFADELSGLIGEEHVYNFFADDAIVAEFAFASPERSANRIEILNFLASGAPGVVIASVMALKKSLPTAENWRAAQLNFTIGSVLNHQTLTQTFVNHGYRRENLVTTPGEFAIRGDILDIYPLENANPVRIELFGDEIDNIRYFDATTQRSIETVSEIVISPATENYFTQAELIHGAQQLKDLLAKKLETLETKEAVRVESYFNHLIETANALEFTPDFLKFAEYFYEQQTSLLNYLSPKSLIFIDDLQKIIDLERSIDLEIAEYLTSELKTGTAFVAQQYVLSLAEQLRQQKRLSFFSNFQKGMGNIRFDATYSFTSHVMQQFFGQLPLLTEEIRRYQKQKQTVVILSPNESNLARTAETLAEFEITPQLTNEAQLLPQEIQLTTGSLASGFVFLDQSLVVITEKELFQSYTKKRTRRQAISNAERLKDYNELKIGDYVVHKNHGIGQYIGIETIEVSGVHQDYLTIRYQNSDRISIPVTHLDLISKYVASEGKTPHINKLNDAKWKKARLKVSKQVEDIADELIELYASREAQRGFAFSPDDENQQAFDAAFPYVETEDQLRSIEEIKHDMEKVRPMDRLLVGDVGFGKTEVALRAAFKAINDHKQVAILVPTTILAEQHYQNMQRRFQGFPIVIEMLSRFRTKKQQEETLKRLKQGTVDIVVGTHRVLSSDVEFRDVGLIIIDEEQRFGVKHKERLKQLKSQVDVLTLTATPIPRTLHMSMLGIRDLSIIETPPQNRYPVQTYVLEMNADVIRDAVEREISRGGQCFYLFNRVNLIEQKVAELKALIPDARIAYAHGQMTEVQLENILIDFLEGLYDVLVTTTIIETGVDMPNVNTLFVENADHMGLSTLYQLRGRVGRSNRIAYAYFMYQPDKSLSEESEKRLEAIKGFTELGSGFKIAMRDLSIRGAGNVLGIQQHGFIDTVGFEMYSQMLEEAVRRKQGKDKLEIKTNAELDLRIDAYIPNNYISDERQKIEIYKRIREFETLVMYDELIDELMDRFGEYPDAVAFLLEIGVIKMYADHALVEQLKRFKDKLEIKMSGKAAQVYLTQDYFEALNETDLPAAIGDVDGKMVISLSMNKINETKILVQLKAVIGKLNEIKDKKTAK